MKNFILIATTTLLSFYSWAAADSNLVKQYACSLNRSNFLIITIIDAGSSRLDVMLQTKFWAMANLNHITTLKNVEFINYGDSTIILSDLDRSGYFFAHLDEQDGSDTICGHLDINLFGIGGDLSSPSKSNGINTDGMREVHCSWQYIVSQ
ncbi:MAG: hypothetical protein A2504_05635 [Bdellovibrionales bacterium RIFOXYD12_FULL_39_22]|nr:MAG: hypothetical protein A2385_06190 [Bdellovibrionales bacterium RIFOXYB1_FULL_39_21]OFZ41868.1 MAG: hypothetical protein A2485_08160 [Bdellovibrionales bacterium RIFOXYC12_FULL_39_17]OFZ50584.1 MAG: hypothetical protein A2404_05110 [Bdellovibrionales bacterium RIFOXYC1_FULL_39_130]OFZ77807.1 MAG: hypothetical protein A2560_00280 [Bdellovibrionales bacterium RIFOXYD1_FULL_39_84]OFZ93757.1 MAG: hypothetical protein A2504_05635 [Bdellovibrionales bacterium RIFOXYD12_FULL_39_22]HLE11558.1 hy